MEVKGLALFSRFAGQLHPLLIHFPIGILLMAILLLFCQRFFNKDFNASISFLFLIGSIFSGISCVAGWFLASSGDYNPDIIFLHRWAGVATFASTILIYFLDRWRLPLSVILFILIIVTGHYGSTLTYGESYFFKPMIESSKVGSTVKRHTINQNKIRGEVLTYFYPYEDQIVPILKNKCYSCHSIQKKKGGLRLDSEFFIRKGGKNGHILIAGNSLKSHLFTNMILPEDDDLHMPPTGKRQLTMLEIQLFEGWISSGAPFGEVTKKLVLKTNEGFHGLADLSSSVKSPKENEIEMDAFSQSENQILNHLKEYKISILYYGSKSQWIGLNFINVISDANQLLQDAKPIKMHVSQLKLNNFFQIDFSALGNFLNLKILNIGQTNVQDNDLNKIVGLTQLEQLNLYGTNITDVGLMKLGEIQSLKVLYLWDTKVTESGLRELKLRRPNLKIESGQFTFKLADTNLDKRINLN